MSDIFDNKNMERRYLSVTIRAAGSDEQPKVRGEAAVFDEETVIGSWFREKIAKGAFKRVLSENPDVVAALNHNWDKVLGRTTSGTLRLKETDKGLEYEFDVNMEDPEAVSTYQKIKRGDVTQSSFAFTVRSEEWTNPERGSESLPLRTVTEVDQLFDVAPCTFGAYPQTSVSARSRSSELQGKTAQADSNGSEEVREVRQKARARRLKLLTIKK
jgi:HK97 family phage prohead protease